MPPLLRLRPLLQRLGLPSGRRARTLLLSLPTVAGFMICLHAEEIIPPPLGRKDAPLYTEFRPRGVPFVEATVDLRGRAPVGNTDHLVPRALVLPLAPDVFVAFDTELLRVAAVWQGDFLSPYSMAMLSYPHPLQKIPAGQEQLAQPNGDVVAATGLYPGWQVANHADFTDPRPRGIDPNELGRGPLPVEQGRWQRLDDLGQSAVLHYTVHGRAVTEHFSLATPSAGTGTPASVVRELTVGPGATSLDLVVAEDRSSGANGAIAGAASRWQDDRYRLARVPAAAANQTVRIHYPLPQPTATSAPLALEQSDSAPATITTKIVRGRDQGAYAVDEVTLPYPNPWQRRIRPIDIDFRPNGEAVVVTFDGDVYRLRGLGAPTDEVEWTRIAAGFNEPQSVRIRDGEIFIFSRQGITRLVDHDGDGVTDSYALFSNLVVQSAETRGYPASMVLEPDGSFLVTVGGIQSSSAAPHAGRALHISADGASIEVFADGLRNSYLNRDATTGIITASDQQGNWVPATPLHWIKPGLFYGFEPGTDHVREPAPVPLWIPHRVAQSGIDQITGLDARAGAAHDTMLYLDYYRPHVVKILTDLAGDRLHAAAMPLPVVFGDPLLKGEVNPRDGLPYFVGMQIWGSHAPRLEGLCRLRPIATDDGLPRVARVFREGVLLGFDHALSSTALDPARYRVTSWEYQRTENYGSGQFRRSGEAGTDTHGVHTVLPGLAANAVFLAIPDLTPTMQLSVEYQDAAGEWAPIYFTVGDEPAFATTTFATSFPPIDFPALFATTPKATQEAATTAVISLDHGRALTESLGCIGCHSLDGTTEGKSGPTWRNLFGQEVPLADGTTVTANEAYLRDSILAPTKQVVRGYNPQEAGMPSYSGILSDADLQSIILYLQSLH